MFSSITELLSAGSDAASGTTQDYMCDLSPGDVYSWTPELRGEDFVIEASEIPASVEEIWNGLRAKMDTISAIEGTQRAV